MRTISKRLAAIAMALAATLLSVGPAGAGGSCFYASNTITFMRSCVLGGVERAGAARQGGRDELFASHFQGAGASLSPVRFSGGAGNDRVVGGRRPTA